MIRALIMYVNMTRDNPSLLDENRQRAVVRALRSANRRRELTEEYDIHALSQWPKSTYDTIRAITLASHDLRTKLAIAPAIGTAYTGLNVFSLH